MLKTIFKTVVAFAVGLLTALALIIGVELLSNVLHPFPSDFRGTPEEICIHVARYRGWVLAVVVVAWGLSAGAATWVARRIGNVYSATLLGALLFAAAGFNLSMLPYPFWFDVAIVLMIPVASVAGALLAAANAASSKRDAIAPDVQQ